MPNSSSVIPWALTMPAGSLQQWQFTFTVQATSGPPQPYSIAGASWEYVARPTATDLSTPLIEITASSSAAGVITVISTATMSQILLSIYPPATVDLDGEYFHSLWMRPGDSVNAFSWCSGPLLVQPTSQP